MGLRKRTTHSDEKINSKFPRGEAKEAIGFFAGFNAIFNKIKVPEDKQNQERNLSTRQWQTKRKRDKSERRARRTQRGR